jgi:hypothetical protein
VDAKELVRSIKMLYLTNEDVINYGLVTPKAINKTRKDWECNYSGKKISKGSPAIRSFRPDGYGNFEKLYWDINTLNSIYEGELDQLSLDNCLEDAFNDAINHGQE